jgi:hypothetical protein
MFFFCLLWGFFETESYYVAQVHLELLILLPQPSKCWNYRYVPPPLANKIQRVTKNDNYEKNVAAGKNSYVKEKNIK